MSQACFVFPRNIEKNLRFLNYFQTLNGKFRVAANSKKKLKKYLHTYYLTFSRISIKHRIFRFKWISCRWGLRNNTHFIYKNSCLPSETFLHFSVFPHISYANSHSKYYRIIRVWNILPIIPFLKKSILLLLRNFSTSFLICLKERIFFFYSTLFFIVFVVYWKL